MKKSKLSIGLVTSFIGALALTSCSTDTPKVTSSKTSIVDIVGYNSSSDKIEINIDELYSKYGETSEGTTLYYNAILEALIRYEYPKLSQSKSNLKKIETLEKEADEKVKTSIQQARDNAGSDGDFDAEWKKILEANNVESKKELKLKFLYELEKEAITDWYYKENSPALKEEFIGEKAIYDETTGEVTNWKTVQPTTENVNAVFPYHVLHSLVKLANAGATDYVRGTISEGEATKLWNNVRQLMEGTFESVAGDSNLNDDGSNTKYGDVGLMSTKTSFYNEFKLGIYAYDALMSDVNSVNNDNFEIYNAMGIYEKDADNNVVSKKVLTKVDSGAGETHSYEKITDMVHEEMIDRVKVAEGKVGGFTSIPTVPYRVFQLIGMNAKEDKIGTKAPDAGDIALPRNVLFNQFLNFHSPFVITDEDLIWTEGASAAADTLALAQHKFNDNETGHQYLDGDDKPTDGNLSLLSHNFKSVGFLSGKRVLCDQDGNVIVGVRSEAGIHFMNIRKSVFYNTNALDAKKAQTTLDEYYTTALPGEDEFPAGKETYVEMIKNRDISTYTERANDIKKEIKSTDTFDAAYDYRIYEYLLGLDSFTYTNAEVKANIENHIKLLRETSSASQEESINDAWRTYLMMLRYQNTVRDMDNAMVHTTCAFRFNKANEDLYKEDLGGYCYVK